MPRIDQPLSPIVGRLEGLHLFHFDGAPCAQRVRFALAEKGLARGREVRFDSSDPGDCQGEDGAWVSRIVSLVKKQHLTPAYAQIQPNLVVPALVHDGVLYTESMDIVEYIDQAFGGDPLVPRHDPALLAHVVELTEMGKRLHRSIRFVSFHWGLGRLGRLNGNEEARLRQLLADQRDEENLIQFYEGYDSGAIPEAVFIEHLDKLTEAFRHLEGLLEDNREFLAGETLTMADVIWAMKLLRLEETGYPFARVFPRLQRWFERVASRPAFVDGVMGKHRKLSKVFKAKAKLEAMLGVGLQQVVMSRAA